MDDLMCPVCLDVLKDPFVTPCGHSFCHSCVTTHMQHRNSCPGCARYMTPDQAYPNHLLSKIAAKHAKMKQMETSTLLEKLQDAISSDEQTLGLTDIEALLANLEEKRKDMREKDNARSLQVLLHFLEHSRGSKAERLSDLQDELSVLHKDIDQLHRRKSLQALQSVDHQNLLQGAVPSLSPNSLQRHSQVGDLQVGQPIATGVQERLLRTHQASLRQLNSVAERPLITEANPAQPMVDRPSEPIGSTGPRDPGAQLQGAGLDSRRSLGASSSPGRHGTMLRPSSIDVNQNVSGPRISAAPEAAEGPLDPMAAAFLRVPSFSQSLPAIPSASQIQSWLSTHQEQNGHTALAQLAASILLPPHHSLGGQGSEIEEQRNVEETQSQAEHLPNGGHPNRDSSEFNPAGMTATESRGRQERMDSSFTNGSSLGPRSTADLGSSVSQKRRMEHFDDLQAQYFKMRQKQLESIKRRRLGGPGYESLHEERTPFANGFHTNGELRTGEEGGETREEEGSSWLGPSQREGDADSVSPLDRTEMQEFSRTLSLYTQHTRLEVLATISASTPRNAAAIISSVAFNHDCKLFATAGVSKRVALYNVGSILEEAADSDSKEVSNRPLAELMTPSKLSCIAWNRNHESHLVSSDYEGVITMWDTVSQQAAIEFEAHQKRIWSVDFCPSSAHCLVSASDDGMVKLWSTQQQKCSSEINMKANVCCAQYNPASAHEIAVACADHCVHLFDLRRPQSPLHSFAGHSKSVSYVRYISPSNVVSASTDSTLRLWDQQRQGLVRTFTGHTNRKHFVGLAVDGDFLATGSETKEVYVYYKSMSRPVAKTLFERRAPPEHQPCNRWLSGEAFISALCWQHRSESRVLLAGSSQGTIKLLRLVSSARADS